MSPAPEDTVIRVLDRLQAGEAVSVLVGDGARPDELKLCARAQAHLRRTLIRSLTATVADMDEQEPTCPDQ